jgi:hypothetical protein
MTSHNGAAARRIYLVKLQLNEAGEAETHLVRASHPSHAIGAVVDKLTHARVASQEDLVKYRDVPVVDA